MSKEIQVTTNHVKAIDRFEVWWRTPRGLTSDLGLAQRVCTESDFDPALCILAVPVAIAIDGSYEEFAR